MQAVWDRTTIVSVILFPCKNNKFREISKVKFDSDHL
jgi:hypothetical protein